MGAFLFGPFKKVVMLICHTQIFIGFLGQAIILIYIEAKPGQIGALVHLFLQMFVKGLKDSLVAKGGENINRVDPKKKSGCANHSIL